MTDTADTEKEVREALIGLYGQVIERHPDWAMCSDMRGYWFGRAREALTKIGHWHGSRFYEGPCVGGAPGDLYDLP